MGSKRRSKESVHKARKYNTTVLNTNLTCAATGQKNLNQSLSKLENRRSMGKRRCLGQRRSAGMVLYTSVRS